ncbi:cell wall hydrolase [Paenibacillus sp. MMO-177]|uniref:cell wall hydrolase n=1 Tax=Paenibacillus sp. MMO-177 TaxID=3081289 RepID=UPI00301985FB
MKKRYAIAVIMLMLLSLVTVRDNGGKEDHPSPAPIRSFDTYELRALKLETPKPIQRLPKSPAKPKHQVAPSIEEPISKSYSDDDLYWLSRIVSAEAKGEPIKGQIAVANVVLNRVASGKFPGTIKGVIFAKGQFSPVSNGSVYDKPTKEAIESAEKALNGAKVIEKDVYYFFEGRSATSRWSKSRKVAARIGHHTFTY